ncbi:MAG TPA: UDP-2,3-diacylglucosamine diphosphatase [Candidatus Kryptonia bacterium]
MKPVYFISDIHLGAPSIGKEFDLKRKNELLKFLSIVGEKGSRLIIVGDLFDFWYEYRYVIPKDYFWLYAKIRELADRGVKIDYVAGNHDFAQGQFFSESLGMRVFQDGFTEEINDKKFLVIHGDGLALRDKGYRMLKKVLRNGFVRRMIKWIHPDVGFALARTFSKKSREYTTNKDFGETDGMMQYAERKLREGYDYVIMGHNHVPKVERFGKGMYINLGDWLKNFTYGIFEDGTMHLMKWEFER